MWQKGFSEIRVVDVEAFLRVRDYIRNNPVRRHLAMEAEKFPFSSACPGFELDPTPLGLRPLLDPSLRGTAEAMP